MEWYSMAKEDCGYRIEWSPGVGLNLRAKYRDENNWRYAECEKAKYALSIGEQLLARGIKEKSYTLQPWYKFVFNDWR